MTSLTKSASVVSTESFDSTEVEQKSYNFAPEDVFYKNPDTGDSLMVLSKGEPLPVLETKYKRKASWSYGLKFRSL
jgi:hypothetical protein